ncbi:MAG: Rieske (2Fe-2S) protein [Bacteroidales bacterium]|nr:Rieske (2Fe-2S) protein [Bacteroidales bacterium]
MQKKSSKKVKEKKKISRRGFFNRVWAWLGVIAGIEITGVSLAFIFSGGKRSEIKDLSQIKTIGRIDDISPDSVYPFRSGQLYLVRMKDGGFLALSIKCTHLGCSIRWNEEQEKFICPCHSSEFDIKGNVLSPPAPTALDTYPVIIEQGIVKVDLGKKIKRRRFDRSDLTYV